MSQLLINLADQHFSNRRPALRAAALLWVLAAAGLAWSAWLYWDYYQGSGDRGRRMAEIDAALVSERQAIEASRARLAKLDLGRQRVVVDFLNEKIDERTFSWSALFDRLSRVLPEDVRLRALAPEREDAKRQRQGKKVASKNVAAEPRVVRLRIEGEAKTDEALSELQDRLFAHPSFKNVNLARESRSKEAYLDFDLTVDYLPQVDESVADEPEPGASAVAAIPAPAEEGR